MSRRSVGIVVACVVMAVCLVGGCLVSASLFSASLRSGGLRQDRWDELERLLTSGSVTPSTLGQQIVAITKPDAAAGFFEDWDEAGPWVEFNSESYFSETGVISIYSSDGDIHSVQIIYRDPSEVSERWIMFDAELFQRHVALARKR